MNIRVIEYQQDWPAKYQKEAKRLERILDSDCINLFHIGSTSVKGLKAKPIIDILLVVESLEVLDTYNKDFEALNYEVMGEFGISKRRYYRKGGDDRTHQIHAFEVSSIQEIERHLLFRDFLRSNEHYCKKYGDLKMKLAQKHPDSIDDYGDGKEALVREIEEQALIWHFKNRK